MEKIIIKRQKYLDQLKAKRWNGKVKIITGIRRCGKSFLLSTIYKQALMKEGVNKNQFVEIALDKSKWLKYRNPNELYRYVIEKTKDVNVRYYVMIDEIQLSYKIKNADIDEKLVPKEDQEMLYTTFYDVLNDLMDRPNVDVYVTGSNSKMLSKDIVTNFRDRGSEIKVQPLSFGEYYAFCGLDKVDALEMYLQYGGMPLAVIEQDLKQKRNYLTDLHKNVYQKDIVERYKLKDDVILSSLVDALASAVGSLTNPHKLAATAGSLMGRSTSDNTIKNYLDYLEDAFLFQSAKRWNVKGRKYFDKIQKYYAVDLGLRNAKLNFRQIERSHLMENMIYNELVGRGYSVDVGIVEVDKIINGKRERGSCEIDFVVNLGTEKVYIQSALNVDTPEKKAQETFSLRNTGDFYRKMVVLDGNHLPWMDEDGVIYIGVIPFMLDDCILGQMTQRNSKNIDVMEHTLVGQSQAGGTANNISTVNSRNHPISGCQMVILANIKENQSITLRELSQHLGIAERILCREINDLQTKGILERKGGRKKGYWKLH